MRKKIFQRGILGFPIGIAISYVITIIVSIFIGKGLFYPVPEELIYTAGNELNAVILQTLLSGIVGMGFAMASFIWEIDSWSLAKQSFVYFITACMLMFPISYFANWMPHSMQGILGYVGIFIIIFLVVWLIQYFMLKNKIKKFNQKIEKNH